MSGVYEQNRELQRKVAEYDAFRATMVAHLQRERDRNDMLERQRDALIAENKTIKQLLGEYATEVIRR